VTWWLVVLVAACLARGEAWTQRRDGPFADADACHKALAAMRSASPDVVVLCAPEPAARVPGDVDGDGEITPNDYSEFMRAWEAQ
jgi:hypothetical protein